MNSDTLRPLETGILSVKLIAGQYKGPRGIYITYSNLDSTLDKKDHDRWLSTLADSTRTSHYVIAMDSVGTYEVSGEIEEYEPRETYVQGEQIPVRTFVFKKRFHVHKQE